MPKDYDSE
jgi:hypothetical protein